MSAPDIPAIEMERVTVRYGGRETLRDFSLSVRRGEKVTLTGPSGAGKTTVLRCLLGFARPADGAIRIFGETLDGRSVWALRRRLAYVAQEPDLGTGVVREAIEQPFAYRANAGQRDRLDLLPELIERFRLPAARLDAELATLSGGEKQRIALISALLLDRPVILLDEASSALDADNKRAVADFFGQAEGLTVLSVSHDTEWMGFSGRVVTLCGNRENEHG